MAKKTKPWQERWVETGAMSEGGGQGRILFVASAGERSAENRFVLKELKDQKSPERRARMHREAAAPQKLDHPAVWITASPSDGVCSSVYLSHLNNSVWCLRDSGERECPWTKDCRGLKACFHESSVFR